MYSFFPPVVGCARVLCTRRKSLLRPLLQERERLAFVVLEGKEGGGGGGGGCLWRWRECVALWVDWLSKALLDSFLSGQL